MRLLKFELYKIFSQLSVWITLVLMLGLSFLIIPSFYDADLEREVYQEWKGPLTEEKVQSAEKNYLELTAKETAPSPGEETSLSERELVELSVYHEILLSQQVEQDIAQRLTQLEGENSRRAELEEQMLREIQLENLVYDTGPAGIIAFTEEFGAPIVAGILLLIGLAPIYSKEYASGVDNYILSSRNGRRKLAYAKVGAVLIYTLVVTVIWEGFNFFVNYLHSGSTGWDAPLQLFTLAAQPYFAGTPYAFTLLEYYLAQLAIHFIAVCAFAFLILLISSVSRSPLATFFVGALIYGLPLVLANAVDGKIDWLSEVLTFAFVNVAKVGPLFSEFKAVEILGYPVLYPVLAVALMVISSLVFVLCTIENMKRREVIS